MGRTRGPTHREVAESASRGALFMTVFGTVWAAAGAGALGGATTVAVLLPICALAAALLVWSIRLRSGARGLPRDDSPQARERHGRVARRFNLVFALQGVAIALAVFLLGRYGLGTFIPAVVALAVGVHFFPLAELFRVRAYHATGAALCVLALVAFFVEPSVRLQVVGLGCAAVLFATAAYILASGSRAGRPNTPAA